MAPKLRLTVPTAHEVQGDDRMALKHRPTIPLPRRAAIVAAPATARLRATAYQAWLGNLRASTSDPITLGDGQAIG